MRRPLIALASVGVLALVGYHAVPSLLQAMGLHARYEMPAFNLAGRRALIVTTSHDQLGNTGRATGVFGSELTVPYYAFLDAGLAVDLASIRGGAIPVEPGSMSWPIATAADQRFRKDPVAMQKLRNSLRITQVSANDYDVVFVAGGWGASYDLAQSAELASVITRAHANGAIIGSVCHGALGLIHARNADGSPLLAGRRVTGVTDKQVAELGIQITPMHPETELRAAKSAFVSATAWRDIFATLTVVDGRIVTGQNQNSSPETSHRMLELLAAR